MWIFISHSTDKADAAGRQRLVDLQTALKTNGAGAATGHDVLLDFQRLEPSTEWRSELDEWLATCHAAVLILTKRALESDWVLKEATILAHRAARDPNFLLFPVLDGVTTQELTAKSSSFSPLYLEAIQRVPESTAVDIAGAVLKKLGELDAEPETPLDELASALAALMQTADAGHLERVCQKLTGKPVVWSAQDNRAKRCAREIARAIVIGQMGAYGSLRDLIAALLNAALSKEPCERILNYAASLWVEAQAAVPLAEIAWRNRNSKLDAAGRSACWAAALNGDYVVDFTADRYLRRAYLPDTATLRKIDGVKSQTSLEEFVQAIRDEVRNSTLTLRSATDEKIDRYLSNLSSPYFVVLPPPIPDEAMLRALQDRFCRVTFIVHNTGEEMPGVILPARVLRLTPPLSIERELEAVNDFEAAWDQIGARVSRG